MGFAESVVALPKSCKDLDEDPLRWVTEKIGKILEGGQDVPWLSPSDAQVRFGDRESSVKKSNLS